MRTFRIVKKTQGDRSWYVVDEKRGWFGWKRLTYFGRLVGVNCISSEPSDYEMRAMDHTFNSPEDALGFLDSHVVAYQEPHEIVIREVVL